MDSVSLAVSPCSARKVFNPFLDADIRNSYPHATRSLSVSPAQQGSTLPEADAPTLGVDPGSTSVSTSPTSDPLRGDPRPLPTSIGRYRILRLLGPADGDTRLAMDELEWVYYFERKYGLAEALNQRLLAIDRRASGPQSAYVFMDMYDLANIHNTGGEYAQAEALASQVVKFRRKVLGLDNKQTLAAMQKLFIAYKGENKYAQAEVLGQQTLELQRRVIGSDDPDTLSTEGNLADIYRLEGRFRFIGIHGDENAGDRAARDGSSQSVYGLEPGPPRRRLRRLGQVLRGRRFVSAVLAGKLPKRGS